MRLNRFLAAAGLGSRRNCEQLILDGDVTINGQRCENLATQVVPKDAVKVRGKLVHAEVLTYLLLNKPAGFLCTHDDERQRRTIYDLLPRDRPRLTHVGRLDKESEGLLILTNDGDLALKLTHPRYKMEKEYEVTIDKPFDMAVSEKLLRGFFIEGGWAKAESVHSISPHRLRIVLHQGIKRQIRLMLYHVGYEVTRLVRVRIGPLRDSKIPSAHWRELTAAEIAILKKPRPIEPLTASAARAKAKTAKNWKPVKRKRSEAQEPKSNQKSRVAAEKDRD